MTTEALFQAWRASPERVAAFDAYSAAFAASRATYDTAYRAADAVYRAARDAWLAEHEDDT